MKVTAMMAAVLAVAMGARGEPVTVYVQGMSVVPGPVLNKAQIIASEIFAGVDVQIDWRRGEPSRSQRTGAIMIDMATDTPARRTPGALAFARPFEGVHITVFYDRVRQATDAGLTPKILAHVMVHEITHVLQGTCRHSDSGVMKARWMHNDYVAMEQKPLSFAEEDVQLIRFGLAKRAEAGTVIAAR